MPDDDKSIIVTTGLLAPVVAPWEKTIEHVCVKSCKLCNSKYRLEAEELYEKVRDYKKVFKFLDQDRHEDISYGAVYSHLKFHYEMVASNILVKAYASELSGWIAIQDDQLVALHRAMAMIDREMTIIASQNEGLSLTERRKSDDCLVKLGGLLLSYRSEVEGILSQRKPITIIFNHLKVILQEELKSNDSDENRKIVKNIIMKLKETIGDMPQE